MPKVKLKDVVMRVKEKVDKNNTDLEFYVGGEHIDGNEIRVTRKGRIQGSTIGPAFHMGFKAGDVLLMSRNPHLRKASMVDFDGLCSDVSYICRTKDENVLLQSYLPFLMQSNDFWRFAEENKKGGLPFFLNWSDFERYEFDLPSIEKQRELSETLWAMQRTKEAYQDLLAKTDELVKSQFIEMFGDPIANPKKWSVMSLKDACAKLTDGTHFSPEAFLEGEFKYITAKNIKADGFDFTNLTFLPEEVHRPIFARCNPEKGDVLYIKDGATTGIAMINTLDEEFSLLSSVALLKYDRTLLTGEYLKALLNYPTFYEYMRSNMGGAAITRLTVKKLCDTKIMIAPLDLQTEFVKVAEQSDKSKFELKKAIEDINNLMKSLMQQDFS